MMIALPVAVGDFSAAAVSNESGGSFVTVGYNPLSEDIEQERLNDEGQLPDMVDLRNYNGKNYVTPVKKQDPFGSCWAFGIAGAAEISFLHDNGLGVPAGEVNDLIDISEKYINWYMFHAITEIQRYLAGFDNIYHIGEIIFYDEYELPFIPE